MTWTKTVLSFNTPDKATSIKYLIMITVINYPD